MSAFDNLPGDSSLPDIGMSDPNGTGSMDASAGGKTKVSPTDKSGPAYEGTSGYGFMTNDQSMKIQGNAPDGENSSGIPAAQPIDPLTYGDPNSTAVDHKDGFSVDSSGESRHGF